MVEAWLWCSSLLASLPFSLGPGVPVKLSSHLQHPTQDCHALFPSAPCFTSLIVYKKINFLSYRCSHFQLFSHNFYLDIYWQLKFYVYETGLLVFPPIPFPTSSQITVNSSSFSGQQSGQGWFFFLSHLPIVLRQTQALQPTKCYFPRTASISYQTLLIAYGSSNGSSYFYSGLCIVISQQNHYRDPEKCKQIHITALLKILQGFTILYSVRMKSLTESFGTTRSAPSSPNWPPPLLFFLLSPPPSTARWLGIAAVSPTHRASSCLVPSVWNILPHPSLHKAYCLPTSSLISVRSFLTSLFKRACLSPHHSPSLYILWLPSLVA